MWPTSRLTPSKAIPVGEENRQISLLRFGPVRRTRLVLNQSSLNVVAALPYSLCPRIPWRSDVSSHKAERFSSQVASRGASSPPAPSGVLGGADAADRPRNRILRRA